jgi:hypothetical protein
MAKKQKQSTPPWDQVSFLMPTHIIPAIAETAHKYSLPATEYCRRALLLRLQADGVDLDDYEAA